MGGPSLRVVFVVCVCLGVASCCQPPDCDNPDCGTCGNACCQLELFFQQSPLDLYNSMVSSLKQGGADGRYTYKGGQDLRPYNISADFILQGWHTTKVNHYNDTLDFTIMDLSGGFSSVTAFSISQIAGAYCDAGQNFKNLKGFASGLSPPPLTTLPVRGCPHKS